MRYEGAGVSARRNTRAQKEVASPLKTSSVSSLSSTQSRGAVRKTRTAGDPLRTKRALPGEQVCI